MFSIYIYYKDEKITKAEVTMWLTDKSRWIQDIDVNSMTHMVYKLKIKWIYLEKLNRYNYHSV